jgi:hypothetical protein
MRTRGYDQTFIDYLDKKGVPYKRSSGSPTNFTQADISTYCPQHWG